MFHRISYAIMNDVDDTGLPLSLTSSCLRALWVHRVKNFLVVGTLIIVYRIIELRGH